MIDWTNIKPGMLALFAKMSGLQTLWIDKRRPVVDPKQQAWVLLRVRTEEEIGISDRRYVDLNVAAPAPTLREERNGMSRVSFDVRVESFRHEDDRFAFNAVSRIRSRLFFKTNLATLRALDVAVQRASQAIDLTGVMQDDRVVSVATLDLQTTVAFCEVAGDDDLEFNIETVNNPFDDPNTVFNPPC